MPTLKNKKIDKALRARLILIGIILLLDILLLPWIIKFPFFLFQDGAKAPGLWFSYGIFRSIWDVITIPMVRNIYLALQLFIGALILGIAWNVHDIRKKNKISDGVGGPDPAGDGQHGTSRWQTDAERDQTSKVWLSSEPLKKGGIVFGMEETKDGDEKVWLDDDDTNSLMIAATRSGKSRKVYLPSIWELAKSEESMIIGDPKGELYISSKEYLEKQGYNVIAINLREPTKGNQWNMLHKVNEAIDKGDIPKAAELAWDIANIVSHQTPNVSSEPIWENGEESTIAALVLLTALDSEFNFQRHMTTTYYLLAEYGQPIEELGIIPLLEYIKGLPVRHPAKSAFSTANLAPYKTRASFFTQASADLRLFADPNIQDMTSKQDHDIEKIGIEKTAVFLIVPDEKATRNVLATLYVDQVYSALTDLANRNGGRIPRRVTFKLDEFGNLPTIPNFAKKLTVSLGRGMRWMIAVQDVAQIKELYDKKSQTIMGNCQNWIYLSTSDMETAKLISERTGTYTVETESANSSVQSKGHSFGMGVNLSGRALLMPDEVTRWTGEQSLVLRAKQFPARYPLPDLSQWKANKDFGFVEPSGDIEKDRDKNNQIIQARWDAINNRKIEEVSIWLPEFEDDSEEEEQQEQPKTKKKKESTSSNDDFLSQILHHPPTEVNENTVEKQAQNTTPKMSDNEVENILDRAYDEVKAIEEVAAAEAEIEEVEVVEIVENEVDSDVEDVKVVDIASVNLEEILLSANNDQEQNNDDDFL